MKKRGLPFIAPVTARLTYAVTYLATRKIEDGPA